MKKFIFLLGLAIGLLIAPQAIRASAAGLNNPDYDECSAAQLKAGGGKLTCAKVDNCGTGNGSAFNPTQNCLTTLPSVQANENTIRTGLQVVFGIAAGVSLITLGIAAFNFATIATDAEKISRSKKAIEFSLIGLAITLLAEAIVTTVIGKL
jgi:hypothetical protein